MVVCVIKIFLYISSLCYCYLFLISSASAGSIPFLSFIVPIFVWNVLLVSLIFLKRSLAFAILLFSSIFLNFSLRKSLLPFLAIFWISIFRWVYLSFSPLPFTSLPFSAICTASSDNHFSFLHFFFRGWLWLPSLVQCYEPPSTILQESYLPELIPKCHLYLYS